jgi:hypothetical protein
MNYMGLDHHRQYSYITLMNKKGEVLRSGKVANLGRKRDKITEKTIPVQPFSRFSTPHN